MPRDRYAAVSPVAVTSSNSSISQASERAKLEIAYYELCTALTCIRSHVALARLAVVPGLSVVPALSDSSGLVTRVALHLTEVDAAADRLERLARALRDWHDEAARPSI